MLNLAHYCEPGEYPFFFTGEVGSLEAIYTPTSAPSSALALLGHPHSLQGGTMQNKVVTTMARAFKEKGIPSIRFNFRGVGRSEGTFDEGIGESNDMLLLAQACQAEFPNKALIFAGFSFGSYVAYRAAAQHKHQLLITVAPPFHHYDYQAYQKPPSPWVILQGDSDEVVPFDVISQFIKQSKYPITVHAFKDTSHFFHGKLIELKQAIVQIVLEHGLEAC